jgi:DNA invertase Pin-like site-specific DNA recombinase
MPTYFYARVSTKKQDPKAQVEAARQRGIPTKNIIVETASGAKNDRPELAKLLARLERGDTLVTFQTRPTCEVTPSPPDGGEGPGGARHRL